MEKLCVACKRVSLWVKSFTLIELMVSMAIISLASVGTVSLVSQISKPKDARRKSDLVKIKIALEDLYDDSGYYPQTLPECGESLIGESGSIYLKKIPCDPQSHESYRYEIPLTEQPQWFKVYASLENESDGDIVKVGCVEGCGPTGEEIYNYGVSSENVAVGNLSASEGAPTSGILLHPSPSPGVSAPPGGCPSYYGCIANSCVSLGAGFPSCAPSFCESDCQGLCPLGGYECE